MRLTKRVLERYVRERLGPAATIRALGRLGEKPSEQVVKGFGYGSPILIEAAVGRHVHRLVFSTMRPGPHGHEHMADRAQAMLWEYATFNRLPRHVPALDVGAFTSAGTLRSVADAREFFILTEFVAGEAYQQDLARLARTGRLERGDVARAHALADYLVEIHRVKKRAPDLYRRALRDVIGHGECIMGVVDTYPKSTGFITPALLESIERRCNAWRWRLRDRTSRLSQVHGDYYPYNVLFRKGTDFTVLDRSRGEWGEPAVDVTSMTMNYLFMSLIRWGALRGPFERLFRLFWDRYLAGTGDQEILEAVPPFYAFRGLVVASPVWYPGIALEVRRRVFTFIENLLDQPGFTPERVNDYLKDR